MAAIIVTDDGRYHGHCPSEADARATAGRAEYSKQNKVRILSESDWNKVTVLGLKPNPEKRAELCASLGSEL